MGRDSEMQRGREVGGVAAGVLLELRVVLVGEVPIMEDQQVKVTEEMDTETVL